MATKPKNSDTDREVQRRLDRGLMRALAMPAKPHKVAKKKPAPKPARGK